MNEQFEIKASAEQSIFIYFLYCLGLIAALIFVSSTLSLLLVLGLLLLAALYDFKHRHEQQPLSLRFNSRRNLIELEQGGQPQIYNKYKVYTTRWFAILRLSGKRKQRSLLLNSDRFKSVEAYQDFRFKLKSMEQLEQEPGANAD